MVNRNFDCVLIGDESLLVQCAEMLQGRGHRIVTIVTESPTIRDYAARQGVGATGWGDDLAIQLDGIEYDWLFSAANLRLIPEAVWRRAKAGAANFHDGPLPRYAGLNAPAWAILNGEATHGVSWHALASGVDQGEIYVQRMFDISADETALMLNTKCFEAGMDSFSELLDGIETGSLVARPQDLGQRSYFGRKMRPAAAATLSFDQPEVELDRLVRALDFGEGYANPLVMPKVLTDRGLYAVTRFASTGERATASPGTVVSVSASGVVVAASDELVSIEGQRLEDGETLTASLRPGMVLPRLGEADRLNEAVAEVVGCENEIRKRIAASRDVDLFDVKPWADGHSADVARLTIKLPNSLERDDRVAAFAAFALRLSGQASASLAYSSQEARTRTDAFPGYFVAAVPVQAEIAEDLTVAQFSKGMAQHLAAARAQGSYLSDLTRRFPGLAEPRLTVGLVETHAKVDDVLPAGCAMAFVLGVDGDYLAYDRSRIAEAKARDLADRFEVLGAAFAAGAGLVIDLPLMAPEEQERVLFAWNDTARDYDRSALMHRLVEQQVDRTPDAVAVVAGDASLTYRDLDQRANALAHALIAHGVAPDTMVGLHVSRSVDLVAGALAIQKAGGAYVPLDPMFPADRLALMVEDSAAPIVLTERALKGALPVPGAKVICIEDLLEAGGRGDRPDCRAAPGNLAYVIYTSGSTGRPKGVMLEHRNAVNFFAGMDDRVAVPEGGQPVWLAVTSLSFDISVLELFWTLTRGFKVVIHSSEVKAQNLARQTGGGHKQLDFGLFYWGNDDGAGPAKYRLLLEGAKFADAHGFQSIWTPERHFHAFGGPYPNPSVTGAAVAAVTNNLSIRAGSCVLPLHHPARVAEEWAVLDNISNGRVGLAFASGWMPEDFVLRPENAPPHNKAAMLHDIETVRKLWRGEKVEFDFGTGRVGVVTQPRPVQKELPVWVTSAGNPETYREAARLGANVLTHLLGQSVEELAEKIRIYRETLVEVGRDPADYKVTLMLHTLLGADREEVRRQAREPMKDYLRSAAALIKQYAWAFPAFKKPQGVAQPMDIDLQSLAADELDAILEFAFLRYFEDSGLFGTVEDAVRRVDQIAAIGVDEVACLIDFGVPSDLVLERLVPLAEVVAASRTTPQPAVAHDAGLAAEIARHGVTHIQCTPSMARMFLIDDEDRRALGSVRHLFIGGEALPALLLAELRRATAATIDNMYGPTETTIWSSTLRVADSADGVVPLGRPIANTQFYALDQWRRPVPPGMPGELYIGGDGVARGYHERPDLTSETFLPNPYAEGRFYRTGDLVRRAADGTLQFLGRADHQVKVRGYRIELGEIEARIAEVPGVAEVAVMAREDRADDVRLVAYLRLSGERIDEAALRLGLEKSLPDYMVPAHFVTLAAFPLTPNAKVDRKALPRPDSVPVQAAAVYVEPTDNVQRAIAETFRRILGVEKVGLSDSFFGLGGHSLLAVQAHRELKAGIAPEMLITDLFRFPSVKGLAEHLSGGGKSDDRLSKVADRAAMRRAALGDRGAALARVR